MTDLAGGCRPSGRTALGLHVNPDFHAKLILGVTPITAREGYRLLWRSGNSYTNEVTITDYPVGRIEFYPSRSRHIDLAPGMRGASAKPQRSIPLWYVYVPRYEPGREPEGSRRFHHQQRKVSASALLLPEGFGRQLRSAGNPPFV